MENIPFIAKLNFTCSGIGALIGWNSILTALDYFGDKFPYNVSFLFGIPLFISTNIFSYLIYLIARYLSLNARIIGGLLLMVVVLIFMPILAEIWPNDTGFALIMILIFIQGMANSIMQGSAVSLASMFPYECLSKYFTGTGIAGTTICLLRMLMLWCFGSEDHDGILIGTIVYFTISASFLIFTLTTHVIFKKTEFCKFYLKQAKGNKQQSPEVELSAQDNLSGPLLIASNNGQPAEDSIEIKEVYKHDWKFIWKVFKKIWVFPVLVFTIYVQTFMMFPGVSLEKEMNGLSKAWNSTILIFTFNIFDTLGKYFSAKRSWYSKRSTIFFVLSRFLFYVFYLLMASSDNITVISDDWFAIVNMALFAGLNGFTTSCAMILAPEECENEEKETVGFLMTHPLYLGIMIGSLLALSFEGIKSW